MNIMENLDFSKKIERQYLLDILKKETLNIDINEIMGFYINLAKEGQYVQESYKKEYLKAYVEGFILRIKEIKNNDKQYEGFIDKKELNKALTNLKSQEEHIREFLGYGNSFRIYPIISLYTTFILKEPIHMVGTLFPGGFMVKYENKTYYCPVKDNQKENPNAVCGFCIAEQDKSV